MSIQAQEENKSSAVSISSDWHVLGPFQIGTREVCWGADPLEYQGGFHSLEYNVHSKYPSSLGTEGLVGWSVHQVDSSTSSAAAAVATLTIGFPDVDWAFLQSIYGWAALQYQAWARGNLTVHGNSTQTIVLHTDNVFEYRVDGISHCGGDLYAYRRAPLVLHMNPGTYKLEIRAVRDVRIMGGTGEPRIQMDLEACITSGALSVIDEKLLIPDIVDDKLASALASVPIRNESKQWIEIQAISSLDNAFIACMLHNNRFRLAPGQSRPLAFNISMIDPRGTNLTLKIVYTIEGSSASLFSIVKSHKFVRCTIQEPHKITFMHPGGIISYAILRAPSMKAIQGLRPDQSLPVLVNLHGAGLEADSQQVRHMLDSAPDLCGWVLFPTGVTSWSGDDWHTWGFADVEAAVSAIIDWMEKFAWNGPPVDVEKWLLSGHSNGGQGTWYGLTHKPDRIIGAVPVSGYSSIQAYVPYQLWNEADPKVMSVLQRSLANYRHELLVENFTGIPILQQHGSADDNVPVFHSRRLGQLISQTGGSSTYLELEGKSHWFEGIMTTKPLRRFYHEMLNSETVRPQYPHQFKIVVANPADMGSRGGIVADQLMSPDQLGKFEVQTHSSVGSWSIKTSNILRFHFSTSEASPRTICIDSQEIELPAKLSFDRRWFLRSLDGSWQTSENPNWQAIEQRYGRQLGAMDSIYRTSGSFIVHSPHPQAFDIALEVSRNLFQYFGADSELVDSSALLGLQSGNVISIALGTAISPSQLQHYPIAIDDDRGISFCGPHGKKKFYGFEPGLGAVMLRPLPNERLELIIWGFDDKGLHNAARLLPLITGVGQPDFVILSERCKWQGIAGVFAMGFFDSFWKVSEASFIT